MPTNGQLPNYINGQWQRAAATEYAPVVNPATGETLAQVPLGFLPYAVACGNTFIAKPSERVPVTMQRICELLGQTGLPPGVVNLVNGSKPAVDALLDHPQVRAISFVGSTPVAKYIYSRGSANGKRVQCQGGPKNHVVVMPDADLASTSQIVSDSAFGCAGQPCLPVPVA